MTGRSAAIPRRFKQVQASTDNNMENADRVEISAPFPVSEPAVTPKTDATLNLILRELQMATTVSLSGTKLVASSAPPTLEGMPYDIIFQIFMECRFKDALLLGLSCPRFYSILKLKHKGPIPLNVCEECYVSPQDQQCGHEPYRTRSTLGEHLKQANWRGLSQYRFSRGATSRFLNICIYGDGKPHNPPYLARAHLRKIEDKEQALRERYEDYNRSVKLQAHFIDEVAARAAKVGKPHKILLPYPHDMDCVDWNRSVFDILESWLDHSTTNDRLWYKFFAMHHFYWKNRDYFRAYAEWVQEGRSEEGLIELNRKKEAALRNSLLPLFNDRLGFWLG